MGSVPSSCAVQTSSMAAGGDDAPLGGEPVDIDVVVWRPWRPEDVARRLHDVRAPWAVAGGWAVDLWLGEETRPHEDLEITVPRSGFDEVRAALAELDFDVIGDGRRWPLDDPAFDVLHQTWGHDRTGAYVLDVFREPHEDDTWICRRDESIRLPYADVVRRTAEGIPFVAPEIVLLFKAKAARPKDESDAAVVLPTLDAAQRAWLAAALDLVDPGHPWRAGL